MATLAPATAIGSFDGLPARLRRARLGLVCGVATVCMIFISLTSAYIVRQGLPTFDGTSNSYVRDWGQVDLPWRLLIINTVVLLVSSVTIELARRQAARNAGLAASGVSAGANSFPWLGITVLLGTSFLAGQWLAWRELHVRGFYVDTNPSSSFAFLLTITHALHLTGGVIALLWAASASLLHRPAGARRIVVDITAWYWHFMAVLWIYVFGLLSFAR
jgi:cytochrome c oxidase subunit 3